MTSIGKQLTSISAMAFALSFASLAHAQSSNIGINAAVKGDVTVSTDEQAAKQAVIKEDVFLGQRVNSKKLSSLQIMLKDQTVFTVGPECDLIIDKFVYDPSKNNNGMTATVSKGMFRFMSGNISKSGVDAVTINTPVSSMGIRGTMVEGLIGPNAIQIAQSEGIIPVGTPLDSIGATIFALRGPGPNTTSTNTKGEINVTSGNHTMMVTGSNRAVFIPSAGAVPIVFSLSPTAFQNFSQGLRTVPTTPETYSSFPIESYLNAAPSAPNSIGTSVGPFTAQTALIGGILGGVVFAIIDDDNDGGETIDQPVSP